MSATRIQQLADEARLLLKRNPLMASTVSLQRVATRNLLKRRFQYGRTLAAASKLAGCSAGVEALSGYFPDLADGGYTRLPELPPAVAGPVGADPYRSSVLAAWMGALARSLEWQAARRDVQVVGRYLQPDLIASDLELERQPACLALLRHRPGAHRKSGAKPYHASPPAPMHAGLSPARLPDHGRCGTGSHRRPSGEGLRINRGLGRVRPSASDR